MKVAMGEVDDEVDGGGNCRINCQALEALNTVFGHVKFLSARQIEMLHNNILGMIFSAQAPIGYS